MSRTEVGYEEIVVDIARGLEIICALMVSRGQKLVLAKGHLINVPAVLVRTCQPGCLYRYCHRKRICSPQTVLGSSRCCCL